MLDRNRDSRLAQMNKKIHGMGPSHLENEPYTRTEPMQTEHILEKEVAHHNNIQVLAYKIYQKNGGDALDNWLKAEKILKYYYHK
jgi:hypothetical protein